MSQATAVRPECEEKVTVPSGGYASGEVIQAPSGRAGVVAGLQALAEGETATLVTEGQFDFTSASATTFAVQSVVEWDDTNNVAVAAGGGDFVLGRCSKAKANGETTVRVILNEVEDPASHPLTAPAADGAIPVTQSGHIVFPATGDKSVTLPDPTAAGLTLQLTTTGDEITVNAASAINATGNTRILIDDSAYSIELRSAAVDTAFKWQVVWNRGCTLSTP